MKNNLKSFLIAISIPLLVGGISSALTNNSSEIFETLNKPSLSPPSWVFPVVWTILFILMGISSYIISKSNSPNKEKSLTLYLIQLAFNFIWPILFFNFNLYLFSFLWLIALWLLILETISKFYQISKPATYLLVPYLIWVTFAGYLNLAIYFLN